MGKFNLKFVKPVASLAIGAAVLTGSFAVSGAADTAFAKAATVKVSKGKLVSAKSGKAVKGYKSYKGILYKNGKKFTGLYKNTYYKTGKKGTGLYKNVYYKAGKKGSGWVGSGSSKKWYQDGKLLTGLGKNSGKLFIKGKYANGIVTYKGVEKLYKDGVVVKTVVDAAKAINNTTVEVTFAEAQKASDISAGRFVIEGLEVTNAAVKQTNDKVIVLTTAAQTGGKTYTVALDGVKSRTFKGVSNVLPTAITNQTPSLQGIIGKEVTVKTQVDVPAGQSKEGIAVTFNITNSADTSRGDFGKKITAEAFTDANGVASYSYTQYVANTDDTVEAYPTGNASVKATAAKVYWGNTERLTITEVTTGNALANGSKKVYKIKAQDSALETLNNSITTDDYKYVNVAFAENVNVAPDKLVRDAFIEDTGLNTNDRYPSQVTTGGVNKVRVKLDANGEATFTVTGSNAAVTPIVFVDAGSKGDKLDATELQAKAPTVTFALSHTLGLAVKAEGVQNAAAINVGNANSKGTGEGGRKYTVTVTDKEGKVAPAGTKAYVTFAEGSYSTDKKAYILDGTTRKPIAKAVTQVIEVKGTKGEATFTLVGDRDAYAAPTVYLENGKEAGLDKADLQTVGETTYFVNAVINNAVLSVTNEKGDDVTTLPTTQDAYFRYNSVDQNEFDYYAGTGVYEVSYQVTAHFSDVTVYGSPFGEKVVKQGTTATVNVNASGGKAVLRIHSDNVASNVTVNASASQVSLPDKKASIAFTKGSELPAIHTGVVRAIDTEKQTIALGTTYDAVSYANATFKNDKGVEINKSTFESLVSKGTTVTYKKDGDKVSFEIVSANSETITQAVVDRVNVATTEAEVKAALANLELFKNLSSDTVRNTVATNIKTALASGTTYNASTLKAAIDVEFKLLSAKYTDKVTGVSALAANGKVTVDSKDFVVEAAAGKEGVLYNGITVKFVDTLKTNVTNTISYDVDTKTLTVDLSNASVLDPAVTATFESVKTDVEAFASHSLGFAITLNALTGDASALIGKEIKLTGGKDTVLAADAKLVLSFDQKVTHNNADDVVLTLADSTTVTVDKAKVTVSADGKTVTLQDTNLNALDITKAIKSITGLTVTGKTLPTTTSVVPSK